MFSPRRCRRSCRNGRRSCATRTSASSSDPSRRLPPWLIASARCISASSCSAPATIRPDGAMKARHVSSCSLPVMQTIARTAERGKFDLFFISDGLAMDPGDHPSFVNRFEPLTLLSALSMVTTPRRPRRHGVDELRRAVPCRARLRLARSSQQRPRRLERRHQHPRQGRAQLQQDQARRARPALRDRERVRRRRARAVGFLGRRRRRRRQGDAASISTSRRCGRSITRGGSIR